MTPARALAALLDYRQRSDAYAAAHARRDRLAVLYLLRLRCARRLWEHCIAQLTEDAAARVMASAAAKSAKGLRDAPEQ